MDIVILHCHFERGGVTQVVENHVRALTDVSGVNRIFLVSGDRAGGLSADTIEKTRRLVIEDFDYDPESLPVASAEDRSAVLASRLDGELVGAGIRPDASILHWHNHSLGKNTASPGVIRRLASAGWRFLLQIHDFAEDYRPENYRRLIDATATSTPGELDDYLYPVATHIHYATLTGGDQNVLVQLGIPAGQTHCLPNSVLLPGGTRPDPQASLEKVRRLVDLPSDASWCLYPVRGIRRKNVGEFLLLCRWLPPDRFGGLTLRPTTMMEAASYDRWKRFSAEVAPRAVFDAAHHEGLTYAENLAASAYVFSSSVAEGFGMAFLEPWLAGRTVIARRLENVAVDFEAAGLRFPTMYEKISIPGDSQWIASCRDRIAVRFRQAWATVPEHFRPAADFDTYQEQDAIDFARLTPADQQAVLTRMAGDAGFEREAQSRAPRLVSHLVEPPDASIIEHNARIVSECYSSDRQSEQLLRIYRSLSTAASDDTVTGPSSTRPAVEWIAAQRRFYPCRTETMADG